MRAPILLLLALGFTAGPFFRDVLAGDDGKPSRERKPRTLFLQVDGRGKVFRLNAVDFATSKGGKTPGQGATALTGKTLTETIRSACSRAPALSDEEMQGLRTRRTNPVLLQLRWDAKKKRCLAYAGYEFCGHNASGISRAKSKIRKALGKGKDSVAIEARGEVEMRWLLSALEMALKLKPRRVLFPDLPPLKGDPEFSEALRRFPIRDPEKTPPPDVTIKALVDPKMSFHSLAPLLAFCERVGVIKVHLGSSPNRMLKAFMYAEGRGEGSRSPKAAILAALNWLKRHQDPSGLWHCRRFDDNCEKEKCTGPGFSSVYDVGLTGLAIQAFLGAGHTHKQGDFQAQVKKALDALKNVQEPDGLFGEESGDGHWIYNQSLCTIAVTEAYGASEGDPDLKDMTQKAVDFLVQCQNPGMGWRYGERTGKNDTSCTALAVEALASARRNGLKVPQECFQGALAWIESVTDKTYFKTGYTGTGDSGARLATAQAFRPSETMTAAAVVSRILIQGSDAVNNTGNRKGANIVLQDLPKWQSDAIDMYYWYWGTMAMFKMGGKYWKAWKKAVDKALLFNQKENGCASGSWDPVGAWGAAGGRVYATALNALTLEIRFAYLRVHGK